MYENDGSATPDVRTVAPREERPRQRGIRRASVGTGTTSLLMIFTVLCFATLAMLSLSTASNNQKIQQRNTQNSVDLAAAKGQTAAALAELDGGIALLWQQRDGADFEDSVRVLAVSMGWQPAEDGLELELVVTMNDTTELVTQIEVLPPGSGARYSIIGQSTRLSAGWEPEPGPGVWDGGA